ncbi:MAG: NAD(+)/NADH kinase [Oscillospiraceae bacterium]|nr:NAD(+)/NADH kinase [Oscillospiraceae bacterium]
MKSLLCINHKNEKSNLALEPVLKKLKSLSFGVSYDFAEIDTCDLVITIGGDGTILKYGKAAAKARKPLLGINTGTLGFMATLETDELDKLERLLTKEYRTSRRMMLDINLYPLAVKNRDDNMEFVALNDVVLKRETAQLPEFRVSVGGIEVSKIRSDGLIFSTPTGSTAYALSAGGPILEPELSCIEFTPLCPHTLFSRTMVFSGDIPITIEFSGCPCEFIADGEGAVRVNETQTIEIKKANYFLELIDMEKNSFYNSVYNKLMRPLK